MSDELLVTLQGGARICVPRALDNLTTFVLLEQETWFEDEFAFAGLCVAPGETAIDVGANVGVYAAALGAAVGAGGRVLAFEPAAATAAMLRRTLEASALPQVTAVQAALSDHAGRALLEIGASPELSVLTDAPAGASEAIELQTLDAAVRQHGGGAPAFIKIDAEGHEVPVARGAAGALKSGEPLVMFEVRQDGAPDLRLLDYLEPLGFAGYRLVPGLGLLAPFRRGEPMDPALLNLFACTPGRARALAAAGLLIADHAPTVPPPPGDDARAYLRGLPGADRGEARGAYAAALERFTALQASEVAPGQELALLGEAQRLAGRALGEEPTPARILTYARLSADLGRRAAAVQALEPLVERAQRPGALALDEPCVPPVARYAALAPGADPSDWLRCAAIEGQLRLAAYSALYLGPGVLPLLDWLRPREYYSAGLERQRQLLRMVAGQQQGPEPHPLLTVASPDNLNPGYWSGG